MQASQIPTKIPVPFASGAGAGFIRVVPVASQIPITPGAASYTDGFPPLNFLAIGSGGVPPFGEDMNGVLNAISAWITWANAGGMVKYDAAFSTAVGGYPQGAFLQNAAGTGFWLCTADNNTSDPDTAGSGWVPFVSSPSTAFPLMDGVAAVGTSLLYAREGHRHPSDTSRIPVSYLSADTGTVAAVDGAGGIVPGHIAIFTDAEGTQGDGGPIPASTNGTVISISTNVLPGLWLVDTSGGPITLTLTAGLGGVYTFIDAKNTWGDNNLTVDGNGHNIGNVPTNVDATFLANVSDYQFTIEAMGTYWRLV